jgi:hypothetical protein
LRVCDGKEINKILAQITSQVSKNIIGMEIVTCGEKKGPVWQEGRSRRLAPSSGIYHVCHYQEAAGLTE